MKNSKKLFPLLGTVQHYPWGGTDFIPRLLGIPASPSKPHAEYWMGAHPNAPSLVRTNGEMQSLPSLIAQAPNELLGEYTVQRFGELPYLFKILDVKNMLSIQVHPDKAAAEKGFARENAAGIPLNAPHRNYKDANHKPELMVALSEFWLLHGFLPQALLLQRLESEPAFGTLLPIFRQNGYRGLYQYVMELPQPTVNQLLQPLVDRILPLYQDGQLHKSDPAFWAARAVLQEGKTSAVDRGIFSIYFFNIVHLQPGEAIFQHAGVPHAYLEGQNVELMANSDNVLRGGLTTKHIDVPELLKHVKFEPTHPQIIRESPLHNSMEHWYPCPVPDFQISRIEIPAGQHYHTTTRSPEIGLVLSGSVHCCGSNDFTLQQGGSFIAFYGEAYTLSAPLPAIVFKASVPVDTLNQ